MSMAGDDKPRTIKLFCPSASKIIGFVAWDSQKLDIGSIARAFGLDPSTVKLNGHFISRGVDLIASSVTWRSLLSFFTSKGLSIGTDDKDAPLIVDGKLCRVGTKRAHEPEHVTANGAGNSEMKDVGTNSKLQLEHLVSIKNKKPRDHCSSTIGYHWNCLGIKRKSLIEDVSLLKKLKIHETNAGNENSNSGTGSSNPFRCSNLNGNMKRMREDEVMAAVSQKRLTSGCT